MLAAVVSCESDDLWQFRIYLAQSNVGHLHFFLSCPIGVVLLNFSYNTVNALPAGTPGGNTDVKMISLTTLNKVSGIWFLGQFEFSGLMKRTSTAVC